MARKKQLTKMQKEPSWKLDVIEQQYPSGLFTRLSPWLRGVAEPSGPWQTYSCGVEFPVDLGRMLAANPTLVLYRVERDRPDPEDSGLRQELTLGYDIEFRTPYTLDELREFLRTIDDTHVMRQTLRPVPLAENSLKRDWAVD